jgi:hypothetical protein
LYVAVLEVCAPLVAVLVVHCHHFPLPRSLFSGGDCFAVVVPYNLGFPDEFGFSSFQIAVMSPVRVI